LLHSVGIDAPLNCGWTQLDALLVRAGFQILVGSVISNEFDDGAYII
jgi:hypothetical protein